MTFSRAYPSRKIRKFINIMQNVQKRGFYKRLNGLTAAPKIRNQEALDQKILMGTFGGSIQISPLFIKVLLNQFVTFIALCAGTSFC